MKFTLWNINTSNNNKSYESNNSNNSNTNNDDPLSNQLTLLSEFRYF